MGFNSSQLEKLVFFFRNNNDFNIGISISNELISKNIENWFVFENESLSDEHQYIDFEISLHEKNYHSVVFPCWKSNTLNIYLANTKKTQKVKYYGTTPEK